MFTLAETLLDSADAATSFFLADSLFHDFPTATVSEGERKRTVLATLSSIKLEVLSKFDNIQMSI